MSDDPRQRGALELYQQVKAFCRDCVANGDMTPTAEGMLLKILAEWGQQVEWLAWEAKELAKRICPHSGDGLLFNNPYSDAPRERMSCEMCDCFGFDPADPRIGHAEGDEPTWAYDGLGRDGDHLT